MRKFLCGLLCLLGVAEIVLGVVGGRILIYAQEIPFLRALGYPAFTPEQTQAFHHFIRIFKGQWGIVAWFGVATILLAILLFRSPGPPVSPSPASRRTSSPPH